MLQVFKDRIKEIKGNEVRGHWSTSLVAESVADLFKNLEVLIARVPERERYNLHYKLCDGEKDKRGSFISQNVIPFDIDGIDSTVDPKEYLAPILHILKVEESEVGIVFSGHGIHIVIETDHTITDTEYFKSTRREYKAVCGLIANELRRMKLPFKEIDEGPWRANASLRLPGTRNVKEDVPDTKCRLYQRIIVPQVGYNLADIAKLPEAREEDLLGNYEEYAKINPPDVRAVQEGCEFLKHCRATPDKVNELDWYKMLSVVARLGDNGRDMAHSYSEGHPTYDYDQCNLKIDQALLSSGPRTCDNIAESFSGCESCPFRRELKSPITIKGADYIKTKHTGFYFMDRIPDKDGNYTLKKGKPDYNGLVKYFDQKHYHITTVGKTVMVWTGSHWKEHKDIYLEAFAEDNFNPQPTNNMVKEFVSKLKRTNVRAEDWLQDTTFQRVNLQNGILDLKTDPPKFVPHSQKYGFTSVLNYTYDPTADCPQYEKFMDEITCGRESLQRILEEFYAYIIMNYPCTRAKALFLVGEGMNGKSKYAELLQTMIGRASYSSVPLNELHSDQKRALLENKLVNISEETPTNSLLESSAFKGLVAGAETTVKVVYKEPYTIYNRAKFVSLCNRLPLTKDDSFGNFRRMLIVPFDATFNGDKEDPFILDKLSKEMSGILNKIIEVNKTFRAAGFTHSDASQERLEEYKEDNSYMHTYCKEHLRVQKEAASSIKELYNHYRKCCEQDGIPIKDMFTKIQFSKSVLRKYPETKKSRRNQDRVFTNIQLTNEGVADY